MINTVDIHLHYDTDLVAFSPTVVAYCLTRDLSSEEVSLLKGHKKDKIGELLDGLEESKELMYCEYDVPVFTVNDMGLYQAARVPLEYVLAKLNYILINKKYKVDKVYRYSNCPTSIYVKTIHLSRASNPIGLVGKWISYFKRKWWIDRYYDKKFPIYNWQNNNGVLDKKQALALIENGYIYDIHLIHALKYVPKYWLDELKSFNPDYLFGRDYCYKPPIWWTRVIKKSFSHYLNKEDKMLIQSIVSGHINNLTFKFYLRGNKPCTFMKESS